MLGGTLHPAVTWFQITIYFTETLVKPTFEFIIFDLNKYMQAKLPPSIKRISNMYVYSNIVKQSPVGNRQVPIMGFLRIKRKFQESGYWVFNSLLYVLIREQISELLQ